MKYGFIKVAAAIPAVRVGDTQFNLQAIERQIDEAQSLGAEIICFPELSLTGYSCQDLFRQQLLTDNAERSLLMLLDYTRQRDIIAIVGTPVCAGDLLLNCAAIIQQGHLLGIVAKTYLPCYGEFYEKRWFAPAPAVPPGRIRYAGQPVSISNLPQVFTTAGGARFGVEICEDLWSPDPPSTRLALSGAEVIFNLSASDDLIGKHRYLRSLVTQQSARTLCGYVYSGCGFGESTQDVVYGGNALVSENGQLLSEARRFDLDPQLIVTEIDVEKLRTERRSNSTFVSAQQYSRDRSTTTVADRGSHCLTVDCLPPCSPEPKFALTRAVSPHPFIPEATDRAAACEEILSIQTCGLAKRLVHTHSQTVVIGISGGLDSTLALLVCARAFDRLGYDRRGILGVTMPGMGTSGRTHRNATTLMESLGITTMEVSITDAVDQHFRDIGHDATLHDTTYENAQARERTQILMDLSNKYGGLVIGTGDLSELALGWCTYNGDHMSMYAVNAGVPKTLIRHLVDYVARSGVADTTRDTLLDIIDTPISPELTPTDGNGEIEQRTEDLVGPYVLHDFFLYYCLRHGFRPRKIYFMAECAFKGQYSAETIKHWLRNFYRRFFAQQFKRSCLPDGPKVGSVSLSPRGDWRMASDAVATDWIEEVESL